MSSATNMSAESRQEEGWGQTPTPRAPQGTTSFSKAPFLEGSTASQNSPTTRGPRLLKLQGNFPIYPPHWTYDRYHPWWLYFFFLLILLKACSLLGSGIPDSFCIPCLLSSFKSGKAESWARIVFASLLNLLVHVSDMSIYSRKLYPLPGSMPCSQVEEEEGQYEDSLSLTYVLSLQDCL